MFISSSRKRLSCQAGSVKQLVVWVLVAVAAGLLFATRIYESGGSDLSYIIAMSVAAVVAIAIVAPKKFSSVRNLIDDDDHPYGSDSNDPHFPKAARPDGDRLDKAGDDAA